MSDEAAAGSLRHPLVHSHSYLAESYAGDIEMGYLPYSLSWHHFILLLSIDALAVFATNSYLPNLPEVSDDLYTDQFWAGATVLITWLISGVFTLFLTMLSDALGRKLVLVVGEKVFGMGGVVWGDKHK